MTDWPQSLVCEAEIQPAKGLVAARDGEAVANGSGGQSDVASHICQGQVSRSYVDSTVVLVVVHIQGRCWQGVQRERVADCSRREADLAANILNQSIGGSAWVDVADLGVVQADRCCSGRFDGAAIADCSGGAGHITAYIANRGVQLAADITPIALIGVDCANWARDFCREGVANCSRGLFHFAGYTANVAVQARLSCAPSALGVGDTSCIGRCGVGNFDGR